MRTKLLILLIVGMILISGCIQEKPPGVTEAKLKAKFTEFQELFKEKQLQGYNLTEAEDLEKKAKQAYDEGDYEGANKLIDKAIFLIEKAEIPLKVPSEYQNSYNEINSLLDQKIIEWKPKEYHPMMFGAAIASGLRQVDKPVVQDGIRAQLDLFFNKLELDYVTIYFPPEPFLTNDTEKIKVYDDIIQQLRNAGKPIVISDTEFAHSFTWDEFSKLHLEYIEIITRRYSPDYFFVTADPSSPWVSDNTDIIDWKSVTPQMVAELTRESCNIVKSISPSSKTGIGVGGSFHRPREGYTIDDKPFETYLNEALEIDNLDIWGAYEFTVLGLIRAENDVKLAQRKGKEVWLLDTSLLAYREQTFGKPWKAPLDVKYVRASVYYVQNHDIKAWSWMFSGLFYSYGEGIDISDIHQVKINRTPLYYGYKEVIEQVREKNK